MNKSSDLIVSEVQYYVFEMHKSLDCCSIVRKSPPKLRSTELYTYWGTLIIIIYYLSSEVVYLLRISCPAA